jgi:hypothetical protein
VIENTRENEIEIETESDVESLRLLMGRFGLQCQSLRLDVEQIVPIHAEAHNQKIGVSRRSQK